MQIISNTRTKRLAIPYKKYWHLYTTLHRITKSNSSEDPRGFNIKFKIKIMKKEDYKTIIIWFLLGLSFSRIIAVLEYLICP